MIRRPAFYNHLTSDRLASSLFHPNPHILLEEETWFTTLITSLGGGLIATFLFTTKDLWLPTEFESYERNNHQIARESAIYDTFEKPPKFTQPIRNIILRNTLTNIIRGYITPSANSRGYPLIIGEHGTGKTCLIKLAAESIENPKGIIYVDTPNTLPSPSKFAEAMQEVLGWKPDPVIDTPESLENPSFDNIWGAFVRAAVKYQVKNKTIPVLIIDNANRLAEKQPELFDEIQDEAKRLTDEKIATIVFVSSEGHVPRRMMKRSSSWSRAGAIIEVGDITKEEALEYLRLREVKDMQALQIYDLVGGRMIHLEYAADEIINQVKSLEAVRKSSFTWVKKQLESAGLLYGGHETGGTIIRKLLDEGSISYDDYIRLTGHQNGDALLERNVFAFHYISDRITFQSTIVQQFCKENLAMYWLKKTRI
ncbi:uncharacterized protein DFL_007377 [Arthrobotrys flagrans]|uniref:AAA+ ATPase domain-containing protein n=1 Tax=Arthrobotrys flagrans TaxID=97331 RepID=A0A436ZVL2_ARTFL|nr:hypothetical protein DFL_007377 [Arthrobotrys flagrans]